MLFGAGIDIEEHGRFLKYKNKDTDLRNNLIFTKKELENYRLYNSHFCYALSFCCKEAFYKAFGNININLTDIELFFKDIPEKKQAEAEFSGYAKKIIIENKIKEPVFFDYKITDTYIVFETVLTCKN